MEFASSTDSQTAMRGVQSDTPNRVQDLVMNLANLIYEQRNTVVRWVLGYKRVEGNEMADLFANEATRSRSYSDPSKKAAGMERVCASYLKRRATEAGRR